MITPSRRSRSRQQKGLTDKKLELAWQSTSLMQGYPDQELLERVGLLRDAASTLQSSVTAPFHAFLENLVG